MKKIGWQTKLGIGLILTSVLLYAAHYVIFHDLHHILIYLVGDIAFLPVEVLFVTLIIHRVLSEREKRIRLEKMNMVIGAFYSEMGTHLLEYLSDFDPQLPEIKEDLIITDEWTDKEFERVEAELRTHDYSVDIKAIDLKYLSRILVDNRRVLLQFLTNPNLLEHESFTELLRSVAHFTEELAARKRLSNLPDSDYEHLHGDVERVYTLLVNEWLSYMHYLKDNYPYFFSLAMRTNPFDQAASPIVE